MGMNRKRKITLLCTSILIVTILVGIIFIIYRNNIKVANGELITDNKENIPDVNLENTNFNMSETELTNDPIIIKISSQLENYNLYYYIDMIEKEELQEEQNKEEQKQEEEVQEENYILYQDSIEIEENSKIYFKYELDGKYSDNPYVLEINNISKEEIMTEELENEGATEEELQKGRVTDINSEAKYYIIVNYGANVVTIYGKDANNEYTVPVKAMVCSTGVATPRSGVYKLTTTRYRWRALFGGVYGQYAVKIVGNILFHSVPYLNTDNGALEYWEYDKLGTSASAGCVRLTTADALWIYNNCGSGTQVEFSANSSNPLGKPTAQKISGYQDLRGYDPTDPVSNNPWKNVNISTNKNENTQNNNNNNSTNHPNTDNSNNKNDSNIKKPEKEENSSISNNTNENTGGNISKDNNSNNYNTNKDNNSNKHNTNKDNATTINNTNKEKITSQK